MDPKMLAIKLFNYNYFLESFLFVKVFLIVNQIYIFIRTHARLGWKLHETKRHFHKILILNSWKLKSASFECCKFYYLKRKKGLALYLARTWGRYPTNWKSFLQGFLQTDLHPKVYSSITLKFINQNSTPCQIWLKRTI